MTLVEGLSYEFKVHGVIGGQDEPGLILSDPQGTRHILPTLPYQHLNLQGHESLWCKVDRVNCSGKVFLEPHDPNYQENNDFWFEYFNDFQGLDFFGQAQSQILIKDVYGRDWHVPEEAVKEYDQIGGRVLLTVYQISKGRLAFTPPLRKVDGEGVEPGKQYLFKVGKTVVLGDGHRYFILKDPYGEKHYLECRHYEPWGIQQGQEIICWVDRWSTKGFYFLEPLHPVYKRGEVYDFPVSGFETAVGGQIILYVREHFGAVLRTDIGNYDVKLLETDRISLRINGFRKGLPILSLPD